jgi:hypothetical protein
VVDEWRLTTLVVDSAMDCDAQIKRRYQKSPEPVTSRSVAADDFKPLVRYDGRWPEQFFVF